MRINRGRAAIGEAGGGRERGGLVGSGRFFSSGSAGPSTTDASRRPPGASRGLQGPPLRDVKSKATGLA